jgi:hypothetical protein
MEFVPFQAPSSDHHQLNTGLSSELGVTAKQFVEGVNAHFLHIYQVLKGEVAHTVETVDDAAHAKIDALAEHVTALEQKMDELLGALNSFSKLQAPALPPVSPQTTATGASDALQAALNKATGQ